MILPSAAIMVLLHVIPHPTTFGLPAMLEITVVVIPVLVPSGEQAPGGLALVDPVLHLLQRDSLLQLAVPAGLAVARVADLLPKALVLASSILPLQRAVRPAAGLPREGIAPDQL